jgi:hypothetical protein
VARKQYYDGAVEFQRYAAKLRTNRDMTFRYADSTRLQSDEQLVELGLMTDSEAWLRARSQEAHESVTAAR